MASNYPPGVTGREYAIGGAEREWEEIRECPHCLWSGYMLHEAHYEFGIRAFCANPSRVEVVSDGQGGFKRVVCPLATEGFEVESPGPDPDEWYDAMRERDKEQRL